ncbi:hypothetical protein BC936DRAFT_148595 [Jimgerdemannia flammicorona]|uniref:Kinesin light chain n=1 Tax=Jimgerdemannia flammicorona TaxID=994334 RepID=A0A433DKC8_9FUNG|nr:hypothetical protein BC936DRAFT_148595 [Jimgerdemannia flammicorona]
MLGLERTDTAISLNKLDFLYDNKKSMTRRGCCIERVLANREKVLRADTASTLANLAGLYKRQSKLDRAEPLYKRSLAIREKVLGSEHPNTATSLNNLAGRKRGTGVRTGAGNPFRPPKHGKISEKSGFVLRQPREVRQGGAALRSDAGDLCILSNGCGSDEPIHS